MSVLPASEIAVIFKAIIFFSVILFQFECLLRKANFCICAFRIYLTMAK